MLTLVIDITRWHHAGVVKNHPQKALDLCVNLRGAYHCVDAPTSNSEECCTICRVSSDCVKVIARVTSWFGTCFAVS
jgi:hypothetical protein